MSTKPHEPHGVAHIMPVKVLIGVFLALVALTVLTVKASSVDFGSYNLVVAIAIAVVKASLVVLFFMHLLYDNPFNAIILMACLIFVSLFMVLSLTDSREYQSHVIHEQASQVKPVNVQAIEKHEAEHAP